MGRDTGYWSCAVVDDVGVPEAASAATAVTASLARGVALRRRFRYRTSWFCIGYTSIAAVTDVGMSGSPAVSNTFEEPVLRLATAEESAEKLQRLLAEQEPIEEMFLDPQPRL